MGKRGAERRAGMISSDSVMEEKSGAGPAARRSDPRWAVGLPARLVIEEGRPQPVHLLDMSRGGFRVTYGKVLPAGWVVRLEVDGWPRLVGKVVWCDSGRVGCVLQSPIAEATYAAMRNIVEK
jgi:hypothetical protein